MASKKGKVLFVLMVLINVFSFSQIIGQSGLPVSKHYILEKLAEGVYAAIHNDEGGYAICNAGIIDLGGETIVLDPFISPIAARDLKQHAEYLTGKPVSFVLNLDPHSDHTGGNRVFLPDAKIIGTPNTRKYIENHFDKELEYIKKNLPEELQQFQKLLEKATGKEKVELILWQSEDKALIESIPELKMTLPSITTSDTLTIYGSKRRIVIIPMGTGHTNGDMVAYLPDDNIIFMSDELFVKRHPYFGDGDPESLKKNLMKLLELKPVIAVPGHGPVGNVKSIYAMIDYIETLTDMVRKEIQKGTNENMVEDLPMPEKYNDWLISSFYKVNLKFLYNKLTRNGETLK